MLDPLSELVGLLKPRTVFTKPISAAGCWAVRYSEFGHPSFCTVIEGDCILAVDGQQAIALRMGDFVLLPATPGFTMSSLEPAIPKIIDPHASASLEGELRHGRDEGKPDVRLLGGYFIFDSPDADLLVSQLPPVVHVRGDKRLSMLVEILRQEALNEEPGRDLILSRLVEVLLVASLRASREASSPPGLIRGLADPRLAAALRQMHRDPARQWAVADLAREAALSRSAFFERFTRAVGAAPMEYLNRWRMTLAKEMLRNRRHSLSEVAERAGYGSTGTFTTAFRRHVGQPPGRYARSGQL